MYPQDVERVRAEAMTAARDASRLETSYRIVLPGGSVRWMKSVNNAHGDRLEVGVDLLPKPYTREVLTRRVRHALANQLLRRAAARC